jgi:hypothetical protein
MKVWRNWKSEGIPPDSPLRGTLYHILYYAVCTPKIVNTEHCTLYKKYTAMYYPLSLTNVEPFLP